MSLPPLNALRAFEAAARHNGFVAAADELCITRGAVSRHVKLLEAHLGIALFRRTHKGVDLTAAGRRLLPVLTDAFTAIERETRSLTAQSSELRIICPPALSIRWLFPRLESFRRDHPDIRVRLTTEFYGDQGFDAAEYDLGISLEHRPGRSPDIAVQPLFPMVLSPACAPALVQAEGGLADPARIGELSLLHESPKRIDWATWLRRFDIAGVDVESGEAFPNLDMAVKAAVLGSGVVMADLFLCREELAGGALVLPFPDMRCETPQGRYCLIGPRDRWHDPRIRAFRDWAASVVQEDFATAP